MQGKGGNTRGVVKAPRHTTGLFSEKENKSWMATCSRPPLQQGDSNIASCSCVAVVARSIYVRGGERRTKGVSKSLQKQRSNLRSRGATAINLRRSSRCLEW